MKKIDELTHLKNVNISLKQQVNLQKQIIQSTNAIIIVLDKDTNIQSVSKGAEKILGYKSKELIAKNWFKTVIEKRSYKEYQSSFDEFLLSNRKNRTALVPVECKDGSKKKISWKTNKIFINKKLIGTVAIGKDVTAIEDQINFLKESEAKFRQLAELAPVPISFIKTSGEIVFFNKAYTKQFGLTVAQAPSVKELFSKIYKNKTERKVAETFWNEDVKKLTAGLTVDTRRLITYDVHGTKKVMEYAATINENFIYYAYLDITAQVDKEALLIHSKETFERIAENTPIPVGGCNIDTFDISFTNKKFEETFGYKYTDNVSFNTWYEKIIYSSIEDKLQKEQEFNTYVASLIQNKPIHKQILERKILCKDNTIKTFEIGLTCDSNSLYSFFYDVTQRKEAEANLRESEARFRNLAEQMFLPVACVNRDGKFVFLNKAFTKHFGYTMVDFPDIKTLIESTRGNEKIKQQGIQNWEAELKDLFENKTQIKKRIDAEKMNGETRLVEYVATIADNFAYYIYTDVTEQKIKEESLIKSRDVFRNIAENTPIAIAGFDVETYEMNFINKKFKTNFGYEESELKYVESWRKIVIYDSEQERQESLQNWQQSINALVNKKTDEVKTLERKLKRKDGTIGIFEIGLTYDANIIYAFFYDITKRKIAEQKLADSELRFRGIVENLPLPLVSIDAESKVIYTNKKHTELVGHHNSSIKATTTDLSNYSINDLVDEVNKKQFKDTMKLLKKNDDKTHISIPLYTTKILCKNNKIRTFEVSENIFGKRLYTLFNDITEQNLAREALIESEQKFRAMAENMPIAIGAYDEEGKTNFVNKFFTKITGYTLEDVPTVKQWYKLTQPKLTKRLEFYNYWEKLVNNYKSGKINEPLSVIATALCKDGIFRNFSFSFTVHNTTTYLLLIDITEQEKSKKQLEKSHLELRTLTSYLQTIREEERKSISREIHDELGQQITGIKMDISAFFRRFKTTDSNEELKRKEIIEALNTSIKSVRKIATQLRPSILDDLGLIAAFEWLIQDFKKRTGINCIFYFDIDESCVSVEVKNNLFRILQESLTNILRHSAATNVNIDFFIVDNQIRLIIADNGNGFNQNSPKATLGILGMRERTAMLKGTFVIFSEKKKGTRIIISIPIKK